MSHRGRWRVAAALAVLFALAAPALPGGLAPRALAHAELVASSPAAGTVVPSSPDEIRLVFSEPIEDRLSTIDVTTQEGVVRFSRAGSVDPADPHALVLADPQLADGVYSVTWRSTSAADGHTEQGFFTFGVGDVTQALPQIAGGSTHGQTDPIGVVGRWLTYIGLMLALGLAGFHALVIRRNAMPKRLVRLMAASLALASAATLVMAVASAIESGAIGTYLFGSRNGLLQIARAAVVDLGAVAVLLVPRRLAGAVAAVAGLSGIALLVLAGHAAALPGVAAMAAATVHVAAAAMWIGGLAGLVLLMLRPVVVVEGPPPTLREAVPRFSALALAAIGLVAVTGAFEAWSETGSLLPADTEFGRTLVLKTALAIGAFALGALNYFDGGRMRPWLDGIRTRVSVEAMVATSVLLMAAALATTPPAETVTGVPIEPVPNAFGQVAPQVEMHVTPGRPGLNRIVVTTTDALAALDLTLALDRLDVATTSRVALVASGLQGMGDMEGMDHASMVSRSADGTLDWFADAVVLPPGSAWDASVLTLATDGTELSRQRFTFTMSEAGVDDGRIRDLLAPGSLIAVLLAVGGAIGLGLGLGGFSLPRCEALASRVALTGGGVIGLALGMLIGVQALVT
jgi:copper transport protein